MTDASALTKPQFSKLMLTVAAAFNQTEKDGFGWAAWTGTSIAYEKYSSPYFFAGPYALEAAIKPLTNSERELMWIPPFHCSYKPDALGFAPLPKGPLIVHGRTATNDVNINNTHPFVGGNCALIHNGVVDHVGPGHPRKSTCDSEFLLNEFIYENGPRSFHKHITGYYAVLAIDTQGRLHVVRDNMAQLWAARVKGTHNWLFCTTPSILKAAAESVDISISTPFPVTPHTYGIFGATGLLSVETIEPCAEAKVDERLLAKSIGAAAQQQQEDDVEDDEASRRSRKNRARRLRRKRNRRESVQ